MFLIRDVMHCKPGQVRPMVDRFKALSVAMKKMNMGNARIMTDVSAERYWTVVAEFEVKSLEAYSDMDKKIMKDKNVVKAMKGYHKFVDVGRREIYRIEK